MSKEIHKREIYIPLIKVFLLLLIIFILEVILKNLPMLKELSLQNVPFSAPDIVDMITASFRVLVLINFAREFGMTLKKSIVNFPQVGALATSFIYIIAILIAYNSLAPLGYYLFKESYWVYQVGFLILILAPVGFGGFLLYRNADTIIKLFTGETRKIIPEEGKVSCQECNTTNLSTAKFCVDCGSEIILTNEEIVLTTCQNCGEDISPSAKFCFECGEKIEQLSSLVCPECGSENKRDAGFCIECGTSLT